MNSLLSGTGTVGLMNVFPSSCEDISGWVNLRADASSLKKNASGHCWPHPVRGDRREWSPATGKFEENLGSGLEHDCGSDHELLIIKFSLKLKKVRKTIRPWRYDINQTAYGYTVEVMNRFRILDLLGRVPEELWMEVCNIVWEAVTKAIPKKKKFKKAK